MRIIFTGGSGKAGRHVIPELLKRGHQVLNVDLAPLNIPGVDNIKADITESGQVFNVLTQIANFGELDSCKGGVPKFDAVVHFAAIPRILMIPDNETYRVNVMGTYNVLEVALKLGIRKVVWASSVTAYGVCFASGERKPEYLPVDEEHPTVPEDSYGMAKVCNEVTARCMQQRFGGDVYGLRISEVFEPHEYGTLFPEILRKPEMRRRNYFAYMDARDLGHLVLRCLETDGLGFQMFNACNDDHTTQLTTRDLLERFYDGVQVNRVFGDRETLYSNTKARQLLGWRPQYSWRQSALDDLKGDHEEEGKAPDSKRPRTSSDSSQGSVVQRASVVSLPSKKEL